MKSSRVRDITLFIPFGRDIKLLQRNLDYYTDMGIRNILLSVHIRPEWEEGFLDSVNTIISEYPAQIAEIYRQAHNASGKRYENVIDKHCKNEDWVIVADLDEFYEYSMPLADIIELCEMKNYDFVRGEFLDRIGPTGYLDPIQGNIWDTYPVGMRLSKLTGVCADKVVLARASVSLTGGHHNADTGTGCPVEECSAIVHHFKWDSTCLERIRYMNRMHNEANIPWASDSASILQYLESNAGKISLDVPGLNAYWPAYRRGKTMGNAGLQSIWQDPYPVIPKKFNSLRIQQYGDQDYLVTGTGNRLLRVNSSSITLLELCDGNNTVSDIVNITREAYSSSWASIEYHTQTALRELYQAGLITDTPNIVD